MLQPRNLVDSKSKQFWSAPIDLELFFMFEIYCNQEIGKKTFWNKVTLIALNSFKKQASLKALKYIEKLELLAPSTYKNNHL